MSDPKRATLITVGAPKSAKNNVNKTVRLTINLDESNESKYPELNYKELVIAEEFQRKKKVENGKTAGLDPFSDNDDDVERVARKFEQKYGGKSTYGRKGRSKHDEFADIGAGYDENDSFIDNTHGYDEMIPPECDTLYGGFYINCGSLEFKNVPENQPAISDAEPGGRRNKRRISSSSSDEESSESSSDSESQDEKDPKAIANGAVDSHNTEHRKKKNKKIDKKKAKKVRRTDSSAATSGKQTSDDNAAGEGEGESGDSRTSLSDSLASKRAPSSENAATSDSCSRDVEMKVDVKLPPQVESLLEALEAAAAKYLADNPGAKDVVAKNEEHVARLERALSQGGAAGRGARAAWARAAAALRTPRQRLLQRARPRLPTLAEQQHTQPTTTSIAQPTAANPTPMTVTSMGVTSATVTSSAVQNNKRKCDDDLDDFDPNTLSPEEREAKIVETLHRLKALIDEKKPGMISSYNAECERVQEERKKIQIAMAAEGAPLVEKRLPKRRFPWCPRSRRLLARLARLAPPAGGAGGAGGAAGGGGAAPLLAKRALPLFPNGFVRMPTLLRQADLSKEMKATDVKRQRLGSSSQPPPPPPQPAQFPEPIQFPSSLTVTTTHKQADKAEVAINTEDKPYKSNTVFGAIMNSFSLSKDLIVEKPDKKDNDKVKEELYIPPNNIGSITITPVPNNPPKPEKKLNNNVQVVSDKQSGFIRVKSPAALNDMVKKDKVKKPEKNPVKEKRIDIPLHVDTGFQPSKKDPSPKTKDEIPQKQIESMRVSENNIPRPALIPVHHSPTFAKPDKRPPEVKKKKEIVIVSDVDPLAVDPQEPVAVDDSSSDVEVVEDNRTDKSEPKRDKCETVPSKDHANVENNKKVNKVKFKSGKEREIKKSEAEDATVDDIDILMKNIREMEHSQEPTKFNSNSYGGVITSAKHEKSSSVSYQRSAVYGDSRADKDKLTERTSLNKMDGCNVITG